MNIYWRAALAFALITCSPAAAQDAELKSVSDAGITVWHPTGMEAQAQRILAAAKTSIAPSLQIHQQMLDLLSDTNVLAQDITTLLGCEELKEKVRLRLLTFKDKSRALVQIFSNIRLVETADGVSKGGVDAGVLQVRYVQDRDEFVMSMSLPVESEDQLKRSYFPVFVNADGSVRAEKRVAEFAVAQLGSNKAMIVAPVHESVNSVLTRELKLYHPFTRWFVEGVGGWATRKVVTKRKPELKALVDEMFNVSPGSRKRQSEVNLPAWPMPAYQVRQGKEFDPGLEAAQTQYAVELVSGILGGNRGGELAKIILAIKYKGNPDTAAICEAIKNVTGIDAAGKLAATIPPAIQKTDPKKLIAQAQKLALEKKWAQAAGNLRNALAKTPEDINTRLNLAWLLREIGERADSERQIFIAASLIRQNDYSIHLFAPSIEGNYVLGKLAILLGNLPTARELMEPVVKAVPDHEDARQALERIKELEQQARKAAGSN